MDMNIERGAKRIIWVVAAIAAVPGCFLGWFFSEAIEDMRPGSTYNLEKRLLQKPEGDLTRLELLREIARRGIEDQLSPEKKALYDEALQRGYLSPSSPTAIPYPNVPQKYAISYRVAGAGWAFIVVLLGLRGLLKMSLWIADGFKTDS